jgi:hypothetical protein
MGDLKQHIGELRQEHHSARYPGDLTQEVLLATNRGAPHRLGLGGALGIFGAAAAAAILLLILRLESGDSGSFETPQDIAGGGIVSVSFAEMPSLSFPQLPSQIEFAPPSPDWEFPMPSFSLFGELVEEPSTSTTQESA